MAMKADIGAPLCPWLFATDAEGANDTDNGGYGVVGSAPGEDLIKAVFCTSSTPAKTVIKLDGNIKHLKHPEKEFAPSVPFIKILHEVFETQENPWLALEHGRWQTADHITLGEGRGVLRLLKRLAAVENCHRCKVISLEDNTPVAGSMSKGRSPAPALNFLLRKRCAHCVAAQLTVILPWSETAFMPADELSRFKVPSGEAAGSSTASKGNRTHHQAVPRQR